MSEDRWDELGLPRRDFLKKMVAAAFVAPVVASFALDGIAEAGTKKKPHQAAPNGVFVNQHKPNQTVGNQFFGGQQFPNSTC